LPQRNLPDAKIGERTILNESERPVCFNILPDAAAFTMIATVAAFGNLESPLGARADESKTKFDSYS
jgi:hypothetical protein